MAESGEQEQASDQPEDKAIGMRLKMAESGEQEQASDQPEDKAIGMRLKMAESGEQEQASDQPEDKAIGMRLKMAESGEQEQANDQPENKLIGRRRKMAESREQEQASDQSEDKATGQNKKFVDEMLKKHFPLLCGEKQSQGLSVFVPLSGESLDLVWLCEQGMTVVGNDVAEKAAIDFFQDYNIPFKKCKYTQGALIVYEATDRNIKFLAGDIFHCTPEIMGVFDCIWDAKSPVALDLEDHEKYAKTIASLIKPGGKMLMVAYEYDQSLRCLFPFSMPYDKVEKLFYSYYTVQLLDRESLIGKLAKKVKFHCGSVNWGYRVIYFMERKFSEDIITEIQT